jgi:hypothetical protein
MARFRSLEEVAAANRRIGHHWFDRDTFRFFGTRILDHGRVRDLPDGRSVFVYGHYPHLRRGFQGIPREYRVAVVKPTGEVDSLQVDGAHDGARFDSRNEALAVAGALTNGIVPEGYSLP